MLSAALFLIHYALAALVCGLLAWRTLRPEPDADADDSLSLRWEAALFAGGSALAPFAVAGAHALWLSFMRPLPPLLGFALHLLLLLPAAIFLLRQGGSEFLARLARWLFGDTWRRIGTLSVLGLTGVLACFAQRDALLPVYDRDIAHYATNAQSLSFDFEPGQVWHGHDHGRCFEFLIATGFSYGGSPEQDFAARLAPRVPFVHVLLVLAGLGLALVNNSNSREKRENFSGAAAGMLAVVLFCGCALLGPALYAASRDSLQVLGVLGLGALAAGWLRTPTRLADILLVLAAVCFWNSHHSALALFPCIAAGLVFGLARVSKRGWYGVALISAAFLLGASSFSRDLMLAKLGSALGSNSNAHAADAPQNVSAGTGEPCCETPSAAPAKPAGTLSAANTWLDLERAQNGLLEPGLGNAAEKWRKQLREDGVLAWGAQLALLAWLCGKLAGLVLRRPLWPPALDAAGWFILVFQLEILGALDFLHRELSSNLCWGRYRMPLYPVAALLLAGQLTGALASPFLKSAQRWALVVGGCVVWLWLAQLQRRWAPPNPVSGQKTFWSLPACIDKKDSRAFLKQYDSYFGWLQAVEDLPPGQFVISDQERLGEYYVGPRFKSVFTASGTTSQEVVQSLDRAGVRYVLFLKSGMAGMKSIQPVLYSALRSKAFEVALEHPEDWGWTMYRRTEKEKPNGAVAP